MQAIILAAGYGTRLAAVAPDIPKALLPVAGKTLLSRLLDEIFTLPVSHVFLVTNHKFIGQFAEWHATLPQLTANKVTVLDDGSTCNENRRGAIGDIKFVLDSSGLDDDVFIVASDQLFEFRLRDMYDSFAAQPRNLLAVTRIDDPVLLRRMAVTVLQDDLVVAMEEKPQQPCSDMGAFALYMYPQKTLSWIQKYLDAGNPPDAPGFFPSWLHTRQPVYAYAFAGRCFDIGTPESYAEAETFWKNK